MFDSTPMFNPTSRDFSHRNLSNPSSTWGSKFEQHCTIGCNPNVSKILIGDSSIERLSRPGLLPLFRESFQGWENFGIGGDRAQHVKWRIDHGGFAERPTNVIYSSGSNNIRSDNHKDCGKIANTILDTITSLTKSHKSLSNIIVVGIFPRENSVKCRAAATINSILEFKLPPTATFIPPPKIFSDVSGLPNDQFFESDNIHLNRSGYRVLINTIIPLIQCPPITVTHTQSHLKNPVLDDLGIGETELLGCGWGEPVTSRHPPSSTPSQPRSLPHFPPLPSPAPVPAQHRPLPRTVISAAKRQRSCAATLVPTLTKPHTRLASL